MTGNGRKKCLNKNYLGEGKEQPDGPGHVEGVVDVPLDLSPAWRAAHVAGGGVGVGGGGAGGHLAAADALSGLVSEAAAVEGLLCLKFHAVNRMVPALE